MAAQNSYGTYIVLWLLDVANFPMEAVPSVLFAMGASSAVGIALVGAFYSRFPLQIFLGALSTLAVLLLVLPVAAAAGSFVGVLALIIAMGTAFGALPTILQTRMMQTASPTARNMAAALQTTAFNVGIGGGAFLGGLVIASAETEPLGTQLLVWVHGGGFIGGDLDMPESGLVSRELCSRVDVVVVSVDYHLADGTASFPTLHRQVMSAVRWTRNNNSNLGIHGDRVFLGGASAGGILAVAATLEFRDRHEPLPAGLVLVYPFLHQRLEVGPKLERLMTEVPSLFRFTQTAVSDMYGAYLNGSAEARYLSLEENRLTGFPPPLVILSEYDDLRPSGESYAEQAAEEGIKVETCLARGMLHGHLNRLPAVPEVSSSLDRIVSFLGSVSQRA